MSPLFFWRNWPPFYRIFFGLAISITAVLCALLLYFHFAGTSAILGWDTFARTETLDLPIDSFNLDLFHFNTDANTALFWQYFEGGNGNVHALSYYAFLIITVISFLLLVTVITDLKGFWYFAGASLLIAALVNYKFELLFLFGRDDKTGFIISFLAYVPLTFYFAKIKTDIPFAIRLGIFFVITVCLAVLINFFAEAAHPFFYLATNGFFTALIITMVFILMVAHQIMVGLVYLVTASNTGGAQHSIRHLSIVFVIYLANLVLAFMHEAHVVDWNLIYINLILLFMCSAAIGIWEYRLQEIQYSYLYRFFPTGAIFYIAMMICSLVTILHLHATINDPGTEVIRDTIIYSHLAYGIIFVIYLLANFMSPLANNLKVYKVLYKPGNMPYFTFRLAGLITFLAFVFAQNMQVPVFQSKSAYNMGMGDMYNYNKDWIFAKKYYEEASAYGYNNHKSNYILGSFYRQTKEYGKAIVHLQKATAKWPTPQSYVNLSNTYLDGDRFFDALFTLNEAREKFPDDHHILNNLGLIYNKTNILDTAFLLLDRAATLEQDDPAAQGNVVGLLAKNVVQMPIDSVLDRYKNNHDPIMLNNSLVWKNTQFEAYPVDYTPKDSVLTFLESYLLYNRALNNLFREDTLSTVSLRMYTRHSRNIAYRDRLEMAMAFNQYKNHQVDKAFRLINWIANRNTENRGEYFVYGGKWALQQNAPYVATEYFTWANEKGSSEAPFLLAVALSEDGQKTGAIHQWNTLLSNDSEEWQQSAAYMSDLYKIKTSDYMKLSPIAQFQYVHFVVDKEDSIGVRQRIDAISEPNLKARAYLDISRYQYEKDRLLTAIQWFALLSDLTFTDAPLFKEIQWYELKLLAAQKNIRGLAAKINEGILFDQEHALDKVYYTSLIQQSSGDLENAEKGFRWLASSNPFEEDVVISAANFLNSIDKFESYDVLVKAIEINPKSVKLLKAYILQCARTQLTTYAEISLEELKPLIDRQDFMAFRKQYELLVKETSVME